MTTERQALTAWQESLEQDIGVEHAEVVVDRVERSLGEEHLDAKLDEVVDRLTDRLMATWRRDLLVISVPQFIALAAIVLAVGL